MCDIITVILRSRSPCSDLEDLAAFQAPGTELGLAKGNKTKYVMEMACPDMWGPVPTWS